MTSERIVFVTGLSGAGKSQAMKTFEDLGFYCVDNLPPALAARTLALLDESRRRRVAISLDVYSGGPLGDAIEVLDALEEAGTRPDMVFLDARDEVLIRRFSETRRRHPFAAAGSLADAIATERAALAALRARSTLVLDTTALKHAELKERLASAYAPVSGGSQLSVVITAFGFKYGAPLDLDLLFDVRFLKNPNYVPELKPLTGSDARVGAYIEQDPGYAPFVTKLFDLIDFLLPRYVGEGKSHLTIGVGCTGGRHRSVYIARQLFEHLGLSGAIELHLDTRDITR